MASSTNPRRVAATAVALLGLFLGASQAPALAGITGTAATSGARTVSSGTFAVVPTVATSGTPVAAPAALSFLPTTPQAYFDAVNIGTIDLVAASYNLNMTYVGTGTPTVTLLSCPGNTWNQTLNTCPVSAVSIGSWGSLSAATVASAQVPTTAGTRLHLKALVTTTGVMVSATATANVTVASGPTRQLRAAVTTNG